MNALDLELDSFARDLFQQRLDAIPDLEAKLETLRARSTRRQHLVAPAQKLAFTLRDRIAPRKPSRPE